MAYLCNGEANRINKTIQENYLLSSQWLRLLHKVLCVKQFLPSTALQRTRTIVHALQARLLALSRQKGRSADLTNRADFLQLVKMSS